MQGNRGIAKTLLISVTVILLTAIIILFLVLTSEDTVDEQKERDDIQKSLTIDERSGSVVPENIVIGQLAGNFARGKLTDANDGLEKDFFMIRIGELWRVVEITNLPVSCERFARLGFPNVFIQDCKLTFSDHVTLSEIDSTLEDFFLSSNNTNLKIIGIVDSIENTENGQVVTINSGGESIQIQLSLNDSIVEEGDLLVTSITPPNQNNSNNQNVIYTSSNTTVVNEQDKDLFVENNPNNTNLPTNPTIIVNPETNKIYKIDAPKSAAPPSYFFNVHDRDNSFVNVELDGNF
ncbi:MAG: hypothetical protein WC087_00740 [Candidatus Paceibacterota bacterium]